MLAKKRGGSVMALMAFVLPVLAILAAFCVNAAQMQLTRTELFVSTDSAAKAAGRTFSEMQGVSAFEAVNAAKGAARLTAARNRVDGEPLMIRTSSDADEIEFGLTEQPDGYNGRYEFVKVDTNQVASGNQIASAVRVHGLRTPQGLSGDVQLIIPGLLSKSNFDVTSASVAMQVDRDISLVVDRSGSMDTVEYNWPAGHSPWFFNTKVAGFFAGQLSYNGGFFYNSSQGQSSRNYQDWVYEEYYELGDAPPSRWEDLLAAVGAFIDVLDHTTQEEQVSLASYSSSASLHSFLEKDHNIIRDRLASLSPNGATAIGRGMEEGITALADAAARPFAAKTMVVMTDGQHNSGIDPVIVAGNLIANYNLTIHTVTFSQGADIGRMQQVAAIGGGNHYHADDRDRLIQIFQEIANNLPTVLVE